MVSTERSTEIVVHQETLEESRHSERLSATDQAARVRLAHLYEISRALARFESIEVRSSEE